MGWMASRKTASALQSSPPKMFRAAFCSLPLLLLLPLLSSANQQSPYAYGQQQYQWPYYQYQPAQQGIYPQQQQFRQFGQFSGGYSPYNRPYSPYGSSPYGSYGSYPYSSPYSSNSYYGYGTNSPYQQRPFGQMPYGSGTFPQGGRQSSVNPYYPNVGGNSQGGLYDQQLYGSNYYSSPPFFTPFHTSPSAGPFDELPLQKKRQRRSIGPHSAVKRQNGPSIGRAKRQNEDEAEFSGLSLSLPLMSLAMPEMPDPRVGEKCKVTKNPEEGDYFMALQFVC